MLYDCLWKLIYALYWKFETYIPRNETAWPCSKFLHSCILKWFLHSHDQSYLELYFTEFCERTLGSTAGAEIRAGNCCQVGVGRVPCPPPVELRVHIWLAYKFQVWNSTVVVLYVFEPVFGPVGRLFRHAGPWFCRHLRQGSWQRVRDMPAT